AADRILGFAHILDGSSRDACQKKQTRRHGPRQLLLHNGELLYWPCVYKLCVRDRKLPRGTHRQE
ncbi:hypothetical protein STEG23_034082, partial [Scotinomys teguina]